MHRTARLSSHFIATFRDEQHARPSRARLVGLTDDGLILEVNWLNMTAAS
jgi:hypothetical protein